MSDGQHLVVSNGSQSLVVQMGNCMGARTGQQMGIHTGRRKTLALLFFCVCLAPVVGTHAELQPEPIPNVLTLATPYPDGYAVVHDLAFQGLLDAKFALLDTRSRQFKGMLSAGQFASFNLSVKRQKFYVGETIHTRGVRGTRQDILAIYDFANLALVGEVDLPPKRMNVVNNQSSSALTLDDRFLLIFNMNPATSVSVVDLDTEKVVSEIQMPGCSLLYPDMQGGFFSLCGNGGLVHVSLDKHGQESGRWSSDVFNDIDNDPLSEKAERIAGVWYFVTYQGEVQPISVSGDQPQVLSRWWLSSAEQRAAGWRPAGWHGKAGHDDGLLWVGMTPDGYNGSHKDPATQVWLFDVAQQQVKQKIELQTAALSIAADQGLGEDQSPQLLVVNINGGLDVYNGLSGDYIHTIHDLGNTPYMVYAVD